MERLTKYDEFGNAEFVGIDNTKLYERLVCDETVALTIATNKLSELEDVLEKHNIESVEELDLILQGLKNIHQENANLKQELAELKQKAIMPKFKIGQKVWYAYNKYQKFPFKCVIDKIVYDSSKDYKFRYDTSDEYYICVKEEDLFATEEEAKAKLEELGENK